MITIQNLSKVYEGQSLPVTALDQVNLQIQSGEFTAIVGPSGSGKSTLLHILGGLDEPTQGSVHVDDHDIYKLSTPELFQFRLHQIGFVFQDFNLIPVLSALENIEFILLLQEVPEAERRDRAMELLKAVDLADRAHHRPSSLSGGQQQRVAVARALAAKPKFVLADEPTANLDGKTAGGLLDIMAQLNQESGITFIFSTHDSRVMDRARRIIALEDGRIAEDRSITHKSTKDN
jgi:putative ABC transport system ATP-binding protein